MQAGGREPEKDGENGFIRVRGARVHNLKDIDLDIPRDRLVVFTGVSGSGKSSLAFDTLYAEGQRRYIESLSTYARQFLDQLERPDVDLVDGLPPTVAIEQGLGMPNPRGTVATITEIADYLRVLFARAGTAHCPSCGQDIQTQSAEQIVGTILAYPEGQRLLLLAPLVRGRKGEHLPAFQAIRRAGLLRARVDGQVVDVVEDLPRLARTHSHEIEAVVDRLVVRPGIRPRLAESVDRALALSGGTLLVSFQTDAEAWQDRLFSTKQACPACQLSLPDREPRAFSFNSPQGACPDCQGLGSHWSFDPDLVFPPSPAAAKSAWARFVKALRPAQSQSIEAVIEEFRSRRGLDAKRKRAPWPPGEVELLWNGQEGLPSLGKLLEGIWESSRSKSQREALAAYRVQVTCPACAGARLGLLGRAVRLGGLTFPEFTALVVPEARAFLAGLEFQSDLKRAGATLVAEVQTRLDYLEQVGLGYLALNRATDSLSGGEFQRVRLAASLGAGLVGVAYILDEPTAGLHPRDTQRLLRILESLREQGNSVLVVEHDEATIRAADWVIDLGPGAGPDGGAIVGLGPPDTVAQGDSATAVCLASVTARPLLRKPVKLAPQKSRRASNSRAKPKSAGDWITIEGAREHNLTGETIAIPKAALTCVTGVSGSGKSTLVLDILGRAARRASGGGGPAPGLHDRIIGLEAFQRLVLVDQAPIGRTSRSTPATYTGVFDEIRKVYAEMRESKVRGFKPSRFSFNVKGGRCETCKGLGMRRIPLQFLPDLLVTCEACLGKRFEQSTLQVRFKGRSISEVLDTRVDEATVLFDAVPSVASGLNALHEAGLGYITLGQSSTTLSGGEAQRVKLAAELRKAASGPTLYLLDEPTTGLHPADVAKLIRVLDGLVKKGHTLVVIEHHPDVIRSSDWIIDLGPEGGSQGGRLVAAGTPAQVAQVQTSHTGACLKEWLS